MREVQADIWEYVRDHPCRYLLVPTNGCWTMPHTQAIMGAGFAKEVARRYPQVLSRLGSSLKANFKLACSAGTAGDDEVWNVPYALVSRRESGFGGEIFSFPTKRTFVTEEWLLPRYNYQRNSLNDADHPYPGWQGYADLTLLQRSAIIFYSYWSRTTRDLAENERQVVLPRPGVGQGERSWEQVRDVLTPLLLEDSFVIVDRMA